MGVLAATELGRGAVTWRRSPWRAGRRQLLLSAGLAGGRWRCGTRRDAGRGSSSDAGQGRLKPWGHLVAPVRVGFEAWGHAPRPSGTAADSRGWRSCSRPRKPCRGIAQPRGARSSPFVERIQTAAARQAPDRWRRAGLVPMTLVSFEAFRQAGTSPTADSATCASTVPHLHDDRLLTGQGPQSLGTWRVTRALYGTGRCVVPSCFHVSRAPCSASHFPGRAGPARE